MPTDAITAKTTMSAEHLQQLQVNLHDLTRVIDPDGGLLTKLFSQGVLNHIDVQRILQERCLERMNEKLLMEILLRKPDDAFDKFVTSLVETGQPHAACLLRCEKGIH